MTRCQICGAPMVQVEERRDVGAATRFECARWIVHPLAYFGVGKRPPVNAPVEGVQR